jgi:hypothetical protein
VLRRLLARPGDDARARLLRLRLSEARGLETAALQPPAAAWSPALGEFILPYDAVRRSTDPRQAILDFAESTFTAGATRQGWDPTLMIPYDDR